MKRRWIAFLLFCVLLLTLAAACGRRNNEDNNGTNNNANDLNDNVNNNGTDGTNGNNGNDRMNNNGTQGNGPDSMNGNYPVFPNSLATVDADVALDDLIATIGLTATDLENAMRDIATVGDNVDGARTYRHKLLGHEADVSYGFDEGRMINKVTVKTKKDYAEDWRRELNDTLGATAVEGQTDTWDYSDSNVKITEEGDYLLITIEKPKG